VPDGRSRTLVYWPVLPFSRGPCGRRSNRSIECLVESIKSIGRSISNPEADRQTMYEFARHSSWKANEDFPHGKEGLRAQIRPLYKYRG
jgi:hypothetical protein